MSDSILHDEFVRATQAWRDQVIAQFSNVRENLDLIRQDLKDKHDENKDRHEENKNSLGTLALSLQKTSTCVQHIEIELARLNVEGLRTDVAALKLSIKELENFKTKATVVWGITVFITSIFGTALGAIISAIIIKRLL